MPNYVDQLDHRTTFPGFLICVNLQTAGAGPRIAAIFNCSTQSLLEAKAYLLALYADYKDEGGELYLSLNHHDHSEISDLPVQAEWLDILSCADAYEKYIATNDLAAWVEFDACVDARHGVKS